MILIKKQKDSKYYDSSKKTYITTKDILAYVVKNQDIRVINHLNKDITDETVVVSYLRNSPLGKITKEDIRDRLKSELSDKDMSLRKCSFKMAKLMVFQKSIKDLQEMWKIGSMDYEKIDENIELMQQIGELK